MSKLDQVQARPATLTFTSRVDARHLATLTLFWHKAGSTPRSISELVRLSVESLSDILVTSGKADFVPTQDQAQDILGTLGLLPKTGIQPRNLLKALAQEGHINIDSLDIGANIQPIRGKVIVNDSPELALAQAKLQEAMKDDLASRSKAEDDRTKDLLKALELIPED